MNVHGDLQSAGVAGFAICLVSMAASVFTVSALLPDEMIEPKWYAACGAALVGGIVLAALRLARPRCMGFPALWRGFGAACVVVCTAQAALLAQHEGRPRPWPPHGDTVSLHAPHRGGAPPGLHDGAHRGD